MLNNIFQPYHTMQEINLDWILTKVKNILRFVPDDGSVGQILRRTAHGAEWSNEQGGGGAVDSVNGQTGTVVLTSSDVGALPDTYVAPVTSVNGQTGDVIVSGGAVDSVNGQTGTVVLGKSDIGLGNVDNVQQYSATNPPPYPVTSVNSQTGAVTLSIPSDTSDLTNTAGFVDSAGAAAAAPVQSVNGQTGAVVLGADDVGAWSALGTRIDAHTFPFTVPSDGIVYYRFSVMVSSNPSWAYIYVSELSWYIAQAYTTNGVAVAGNIPVKAGWTLTNPVKQNCNLDSLYFIPFE